MKATMAGLNSVLFEQIERLNDDDLKGEELKEQLHKSKAIGDISKILLESAELELKARIYVNDSGDEKLPLLEA